MSNIKELTKWLILCSKYVIFVAENHRLSNPIDWKWVVTTLIAVGVLLVGIAILLLRANWFAIDL